LLIISKHITMNPESFLTNYQAALATQNWESVAPLIHADACVTFSRGSVHKGIAAIQEAYERNFAAIKSEEYQVTNVDWLIKNADSAVYVFSFSWKGLINGQPASGTGRGTAVLVFESGKWKLMAEHLGPGK
jgi:ketosteroid isomerase-like protein